MSGGRFDYLQYRFTEIIDEIEQEVFDNPHEFSEETIAEFKRGIELLREAQVYAQRIDWLLSGDDGEETFHERLAEDLADLRLRGLC